MNLRAPETNRWSVWVNGNWRITFEFEGENAILVDYEDYH
ncbi:hypothetical protein DQM68_19775 (plasmid) [Leptospira mayottensis]|nr:hypothetical protein DQM68_19775 [Leptospira mayottensis]